MIPWRAILTDRPLALIRMHADDLVIAGKEGFTSLFSQSVKNNYLCNIGIGGYEQKIVLSIDRHARGRFMAGDFERKP